jgi:hypothetical protein
MKTMLSGSKGLFSWAQTHFRIFLYIIMTFRILPYIFIHQYSCICKCRNTTKITNTVCNITFEKNKCKYETFIKLFYVLSLSHVRITIQLDSLLKTWCPNRGSISLNPFWSYVGPRPTLWFSWSDAFPHVVRTLANRYCGLYSFCFCLCFSLLEL